MKGFLVITDINTYDEDIGYCGLSEIEAYKRFKILRKKHKRVNIVRADVEKISLKNIDLIRDYEIIEVIK